MDLHLEKVVWVIQEFQTNEDNPKGSNFIMGVFESEDDAEQALKKRGVRLKRNGHGHLFYGVPDKWEIYILPFQVGILL